jgi:acyl-coenzyme A synthetase/AMP-(fatty) acid ligase
VVFRAELPKTSTGKIQKYVLRNLAKEMGPTRKGATTTTTTTTTSSSSRM